VTEPTKAHVVAALARAKELVDLNHFDLIQALAEATTTEQCQGVAGYKVFRDARAAVQSQLIVPLPDFQGDPSELLGGLL